jgi:RsiW-degrading membrane proteinase PrsW (M82 family)
VLVTRRYLKFDLSLPFIGKSVAASVVMALCVWLMRPETIAWVIISIILGALIYFAALMLMRGFSKGEINFFINLVKDNLRKIKLSKG